MNESKVAAFKMAIDGSPTITATANSAPQVPSTTFTSGMNIWMRALGRDLVKSGIVAVG